MMRNEVRRNWLLSALSWGLLVHVFFVCQLIFAAGRHALILRSLGVIFMPQAILMYSLPPADPWGPNGLDLLRITGKIVDALPASLAYGVVITVFCKMLIRLSKRTRRGNG
jgi:hypothetical protein